MGTRIAVMSDGLLQQVGTPQALYDTPVNRFVAGFIGSPAMNFIDVTVNGDGDGRARWADFNLPLPARCATPSVRSAAASSSPGSGRSISTSSRRSPATPRVQVKADVVEYLGNEELLHVTVGAEGAGRDRRHGAQRPARRHRQPGRAARQGPPLRRRVGASLTATVPAATAA